MDKFLKKSTTAPILITDDTSTSDTSSNDSSCELLSESPPQSNEAESATMNSNAILSASPVSEDDTSHDQMCSATTSSQTVDSSGNPWPYIEEFFLFLGKKSGGRNIEFQCLLCKPLIKKFSTSRTSANNLKKHIKSVHPLSVNNFQKVFDEVKQSRKRKISVEKTQENQNKKTKPSDFFQSRSKLTGNAAVSQELYENKVSFLYLF